MGDRPQELTEEQAAEFLHGPLHALAEKSWRDGPALPRLAEFVDLVTVVGTPPTP